MGKTGLVAGAAAGIGRAGAMRLAREGMAVGVLDVNLDSCEKVVAEIEAAGGEAIALKAGVADRTAAAELRLRIDISVFISRLSQSGSLDMHGKPILLPSGGENGT